MSRKALRTATLTICALLVTSLMAFTGSATFHLQDDQQQDPFQDDQQQDQPQDDQQQDPFQDDQQQNQSQDDQQQDDVGQEVGQQQDDEASVTFQDQTSENQEVEVARAVLPEGGYIVLREDSGLIGGFGNDTFTDGNATGGNESAGNGTEPLGVSAHLEAGTHENVTIRLNQTQDEDEMTLTAVLYRESSGDQTFDAEQDQPYQSDGEDVSDSAQVGFQEDVGAQPSPTEEDRDTPAPGVLVILTALASIALWARRRH